MLRFRTRSSAGAATAPTRRIARERYRLSRGLSGSSSWRVWRRAGPVERSHVERRARPWDGRAAAGAVHGPGGSGAGRVPGRLQRPDPRRVPVRPAPVRGLVHRTAPDAVRGAPGGHRAVRSPPRGSRPRAGDGRSPVVHDRLLLPLCRAGGPHRTVGERAEGPIFCGDDGRRLDRHAVGRIVRRLAKRAGIAKPVGPHTLRHAFITAALDAGVPLRDVQEAASHADPRTTMRYDHGRVSLDHHVTYVVSAFLAGAAR